MPDWPQRLPPNTILTPHPGEMARLVGRPLSAVRDEERVELAREPCGGLGPRRAAEGGLHRHRRAGRARVTLLPFANPLLAVGGSGDVLAGIIVSLLAQGAKPL
jgi:NAD(P)H-hydrate repair Nnr-like enzyme with NAD(P)H-hydrate dehydratase domain